MNELLFSVPLFLVVILVDSVLNAYEGKDLYLKRDTLNNFLVAISGLILDVALKGFVVLLLFWCSIANPFLESINPVVYFVVLFLLHDFLFYLLHLSEHKIRLLWASHFVHHSSERFNFSTSIRVSVFQPMYRFLFYFPLVLIGFHPVSVLSVHYISKIYVFFLHTQRIGKLGVLEWFMNTPSHHRVHHGSNACYIDKNMGNVLIIWDRLFGTFAEEREAVVFGTTKKPASPAFHRHLFFEYQKIISDFRNEKGLKLKLLKLWKMD